MKNLIKKTKRIHRKSFTLIELIAVIVVIGILAAIVIPNISSFKEEAKETAMVADGKNLQTAIDMYQLDQHGDLPTIKGQENPTKPVLGNPQSVDFNALYPAYIRDLPKGKEMYYWIDYQGQFYYSTVDNPKDFTRGDSKLTWTANKKAAGYRVYEEESNTTGASKKTVLTVAGELSGTADSFVPNNYSKDKAYFIQVVDEYKNEAPPVSSGYVGSLPFIHEEFEPIGTSPSVPGESETVIPPTTPEQEELIGNPTNKKVVAGGYHTAVINKRGELWVFGRNNYGQLGHSDNIGKDTPNSTPKKVMDGVKSIALGYEHTLVLKENGELWTFGYNFHGQLGHSANIRTLTPNSTPEKIMDGIESVSANGNHSLAVDERGKLWTFGFNQYGQLGHTANNGNNNPNALPKMVMEGVKAVSAGSYHTLIIKENNELWSFGQNYSGQLGHSTNNGSNKANPTPSKIMENVRTVSAGESHSLIVNQSGELWTFGNNNYGQLGHSANNGNNQANPIHKKVMEGVKNVSTSNYHSLVLKENNELWSFGDNSYGQHGHSTVNAKINPTPLKVMDEVESISGGIYHSIITKNNEEIWTFGYNYYGQLGHSTNSGNSSPNPTPVQVHLNN